MSFSIGLALIFGTMRVINYTHGEMFMLGAYTLWGLSVILKGLVPGPVIFLLAIVLAMLLMGTLGMLLHVTIISRLKNNAFAIFMATLGLSYAIQVIMIQVAGPIGKTVPPMFGGVQRFAGMLLPNQRLVLCVVAILAVALLAWFLLKTRYGRGIRATAQNATGAILYGVDSRRIALLTMFLGCALAAMSGVLMASMVNINPFMGGDAIWRAFIIIIVGGIGSLSGAVLASVLFGALDTVLTTVGYGQYTALLDATIMLAILAFRPNGLLGDRE